MKDTSPLLGVILAGGKSRRMDGQDKYCLPFGENTLFSHIADRLGPQVDKLIINANKPANFKRYEVVPDEKSNLGPIGGLYSALKYASQNGYKKIVTVPCDTPFIPGNFVEKLVGCEESRCVVASSLSRIHPVLALWDISVIDDVMTSIEHGERKLMTLLKGMDHGVCQWAEGPDPFFNINTPEDLKIAESRLNS